MGAKDVLGRRGEDLAAAYLAIQGMTVIDRNWRCPQGEIDLVCADGGETVFVEVKTRSSTVFGHPFDAITDQKLTRMRRLAGAWCEAHESRTSAIRIDVVAIVVPADARPAIEHLRGVFR